MTKINMKIINYARRPSLPKFNGVKITPDALEKDDMKLAEHLNSVGELHLLGDNFHKGRRYLKAAAVLFEELADNEKYASNVLDKYDYAARSYISAGRHFSTRRIYQKQIEHCKTLLRTSHSGDADIMIRASLIESALKSYNPIKLAIRIANEKLDSFFG